MGRINWRVGAAAGHVTAQCFDCACFDRAQHKQHKQNAPYWAAFISISSEGWHYSSTKKDAGKGGLIEVYQECG